MSQLIQCVPNFSEGRRQDVIRAILNESKVEGVSTLGIESDPDHNRSVLTFMGAAGPVVEAAFRCCRKAASLIDLNTHKGQHPRMGATDVIPFIPVRKAEMYDCVAAARVLGERIGSELGIPVYLYGEAASSPWRSDLSVLRRGEFEAIRDEIGKVKERAPDFGPCAVHPTAGATAVGARFFLIAFNVNLKTADPGPAKRIAKRIRTSSGGLPNVKALGLTLADRGITQVSMNLTDYRVTSPARVVAEIGRLAAAEGVEVCGSELIGFAPADALVRSAAEALCIERFDPGQILENRI